LWDFLSSTYKTMDKVQNKPNSSVQHVIGWSRMGDHTVWLRPPTAQYIDRNRYRFDELV
jgi:hypothetical protein